jgi:hypothetical protein
VGNDDPGSALRSTAKRFGGPSQAGNDAIAEAVRFPVYQKVIMCLVDGFVMAARMVGGPLLVMPTLVPKTRGSLRLNISS